MHRILRRTALIAASTLAAGLLTSPAAHAADPSPGLAADWLELQLTDGLVESAQFPGFYDDGLTIDVAFGLQASRAAKGAAIDAIDTALQSRVGDYTGAAPEAYAGATAKLAVFVQSLGGDATAYGSDSTNLVLKLNRRVSTKTAIKGRIQDKSQYGDYANVIGQAFAVRALKTAGTGKADAALGFLLKQQCRDGHFRLNFAASTTTTKQGCNAGNPETVSAPDTDTTAVAVIQLQALKGKNLKTKRAITKAVAWLKAHQKSNGAFGGGTTTEGSNTNSTGLAGWALGVAHSCGAAQDAAEWVARWQVLDDAGPLTGELGAVAYDRPGFNVAAQTDGITDATRDQWRRATAQATPALANLVLADCKAS